MSTNFAVILLFSLVFLKIIHCRYFNQLNLLQFAAFLSLEAFSYGPHGYSRVDLVATDIMRGRDHGLPNYNSAREMLGLEPFESFQEIVPDNSTITDEVSIEV